MLVGGLQACSAGSSGKDGGGDNGSGGTGADDLGGVDGADDLGGLDTVDGADGNTDGGDNNPTTCAQAAQTRSYIGCDFWPTITYNPVDKHFNFAAVVANAGAEPAEVTVTRGGAEVAKVTVQPGGLEKIILPWIDELKGPTFVEENTSGARASASVRLNQGAYHLTSTLPVTAWQFNPLEFNAGVTPGCISTYPAGAECLSVTNDASLLLPSSAMTGNYRVANVPTAKAEGGSFDDPPPFIAITATADGTNVKVQLGPKADVQASAGVDVPTTAAGGEIQLAMNAGDVVQILGKVATFDTVGSPSNFHGDLVGTLVAADKPVQVISGVPITYMPSPAAAGQGYADHIEEALLPAEVLGKKYIVVPPTTPSGGTVGHFVRIVGNFDGTTLTYEGTAPAGAPTTLNAGESSPLMDATAAFVVNGTESFSVLSVMKGGQIQEASSGGDKGDPSMSFVVAPDQFRSKYIFLAPDDYTVKYADILVPDGATVTVDGTPVVAGTPVAAGWSIVRQLLGPGVGGAHVLEASTGVGLQVMGFGRATAFYVPGGLDLKLISKPPVVR